MIENNVKISIIMPVYKVENYVGRAIESILNQTLTEFELIAVDDGTPDNSGRICDEYAAKDSRVRVIHKENGGAPSARNMAIPRAKGKYLYFLDSDDWAEPAMLEDMYNLAEQHNAQCVVSGFYIDTYYNDTEYLRQEIFEKDAVYKNKEDFRQNAHKLFDNNLLYTPWNKLYRADYLSEHDILFPQTFWDDFPFNILVVRDVERIVVTSKMYYHFIRARAESETAKYMPKMYEKREEEHQWMLDLYKYWGVDTPESREFIARRYIERIVGCVENLTNPQCTLSKTEQKAEITKIISDPKVRENLKYMEPKSSLMKLMLIPIRWNNTALTYLEGKTISYVKSNNTKLFASLKARR